LRQSRSCFSTAAGCSRHCERRSTSGLQNLELVEELRAQKKAAEDANVAKSRFLAVASHDLRQPLHALELFVQALEDTPLPAHAHQLVGNVRRSVDSMEELFDALLDISRRDARAELQVFIMPTRRATSTACVRFTTPNTLKIAVTWAFTVFSDRPSSVAICLLVLP